MAIVDREAREMIRLVASVCLSVRLSSRRSLSHRYRQWHATILCPAVLLRYATHFVQELNFDPVIPIDSQYSC